MRAPVAGGTYRSVWLGTALVLTTLGWAGALLSHPLRVTLWTFVATWVMGALGTIIYLLQDDRPSIPVRTIARLTSQGGGVLAAAVVAFVGYVAFLGGWSFPLLLLAVVTSPWCVDLLRRHTRDSWPLAPAPVVEPRFAQPHTPSPTQPVGSLDTTQLCHAWRVSYLELQHAPTRCAREQIVARRQAYLDELASRNPPGFEAWLHSGARAASDPERFF